MGKDKHARREDRVTVMALGNLIASMVDTMRDADVPNHVVHRFLNRLDRLNASTLYGDAGVVMLEITDVIRDAVPGND